MSDHPILHNAIVNPITEDDIANYLANTPDFFERQAELLAAVQLTSPHSHRAISLQERQAALLREKIKLLEARIMEMIRNVNENTLLSDKLLQWAQALFLNVDPLLLPDLMARDLADRFAVPQVAIKVWDVAPAFLDADFAQGVSEDDRLFADGLTEPFCGVPTTLEVVRWLPDPKAVASIALLPLRSGPLSGKAPAFGLLLLASPDSQRYTSTMGVDFLVRVAELASAALSRLR